MTNDAVPNRRSLTPFIVVAVLGLLLAAGWHLKVTDLFLPDTQMPQKLREFFLRFSQPEWRLLPYAVRAMGQTIATGFWGTFLALGFAILFAPLAVQGFAPRPIYRAARETMNLFRALPDFLLTLVFLNALSLGPWPAVLALGLHSGANLGKFISENMERVDKGVYEALRASGSGFDHMVIYGAWPSVLREAAAYTLYVFDRNVRMATILGVVGAGGIGESLKTSLGFRNFPHAAAIILVIIATILLIDITSTAMRRRLA